jgi:hypothetical protein
MNKKQYLKLLKSQEDVWSRFIVWLSQKKRKKRYYNAQKLVSYSPEELNKKTKI